RDRRAADDRGVGELDEPAAGHDLELRAGGVMTTEKPSAPAESDEAAETRWSSKPEVDRKRPPTAPSLGLRGTLRFLWRQLTSMQTALILLMLLAIAAVPGSLYPQRSVNPALTEQFLAENGRWGEILD